MPAITFNLNAVDCPAPQVPAAMIDPTGAGVSPLVLDALFGPDMEARFNRDAKYVETLGRLGAGVYGIGFGLGISSADGGLTLTVAAGQALLDAPITKSTADASCALGDSTDNYCWISQHAAIQKRTPADGASKLLPPDSSVPSAYLGRLTKTAQVTTAIDRSGVVFVIGGLAVRRTGDLGVPGDTPPATWAGLTITAGGCYLWDGTAYRAIATAGGPGDPAILSVKDTVRVATAANLPAYTRVGNAIAGNAVGALPAIDGVTLVAGDRLLFRHGGGSTAAHADDGIYAVTQVGDGGHAFILTRTPDADTSAKVTAGLFLWTSTEGSTLDNTQWLLTTPGPITLNTTALEFTNVVASGGSTPSGAAGGDLDGSYPNPTLAAAGPGATGPVGDATHVAAVTIDAKGRVTALSSVAITGGPPSGAAGGDLAGTYPNPTIAPNAVTNAKAAQMASKTLKGNVTGGAANPADVSVSQVNAMLLDGATLDNSGAGGTAEIKPGGVETGQIAANAVTLAKLATQADQTLLGNVSGAGAVPSALTVAQAAALLAGTTGSTLAVGNDGRFTRTTRNHQTGTSYTLVLTDAGLIIDCDNASPFALTIPANASVAFPVGTTILIGQGGAGQVTVGITSDTLRSPNGAKTPGQYRVLTLWKRDTTEWWIMGDSSA